MKLRPKPYPEYKDSGLPWIDKIPRHWDIFPNRAIFRERIEKNNTEEELLSVTIKGGLIRQKDFLRDSTKKDSSNEDKSNYKLVMPGDLAYNKMRMWQGAVGASNYRGLVSPAYIVITPRSNVNYWYCHYLFRIPEYVKESYRYSYGICDDQLSLRFKDFKIISTLVPPLEEQKVMVDFIKSKSRQISNYTRAKRRMIELLKEQKQVIINHAVTKGINPNIKLKPSGIDYLGDIPEHWEIRRLRTIAIVKPSGVDKNTVDGEIPISLCNYVDVYKNDNITSELSFMKATASQAEIDTFQLKAGDVIITKDSEDWTDIAVPAYVMSDLEDVICAYHLAMIRPKKELILGEYLFRAFSSEMIANQFRISANGITRYGLSQNSIKSAFFPVPPIEEQEKVIEYINERCKEANAAIIKANREIELIREYRTRLISDVVTGKVDVRDIPVEPVEDIEEMEELEEIQESEKLTELQEVTNADD